MSLDTDARFRRKCDETSEALAENILASLYSKAIKGTVPAHALWFKAEAARKSDRQQDQPLNPDELLAEFDRIAAALRTVQREL